MKAFRRFTSRLSASFDWVSRQVENHEALVNCTIRDVSRHAAQAKVQLRRVERDGRAMKRRIKELHEQALLWEDRARQSKEQDEKKALECLRRKRKAEKEVSELELQAVEHKKVEDQLKRELSAIEEKLQQLTRQRNLMRTRESRAAALTSLPGTETQLVSEIEEVFDRWDARVTQYELQTDSGLTTQDELEEEFLSQEEEQELSEELASL